MTISFKTQSNSPIFALWERFEPEVPISWQLFLSHNVCLCDIYQQLWRQAVFFLTGRSNHKKTVKCAIFQVFEFGSCKLFIKSYVLCFFLHFLTLEIPREVNLTPLGFFIFFQNPQKVFGKKLSIPRGFNLWSFDGQMNVRGRPYPKLWGKHKKPYPRFS